MRTSDQAGPRANAVRGRVGGLVHRLAFALLFATGACGSEPGGPGALRGIVEAPDALGAVTLEVVGRGVTGFEGLGDTRAWGTTISAGEGRHRVVLVNPLSGELTFRILVEDVTGAPPTVSVVSAAGTDDLERIASGIAVRLER